MTTNSLATVLVKVLGLSFTVSGIASLASGISAAVSFIMSFSQEMRHSNTVAYSWWQTFSNFGIYGILDIALGLFLIIKASYVVTNLLKIRSET
jgi:hypothetical protein